MYKAQADGALFFLKEVDFFENEEGSPLLYDLTYTSWNADLRMNFTYYDEMPLQIDSLAFSTKDSRFSGKAKRLFIEPGKSDTWVHRYTVVGKVHDFTRMYNPDAEPEITLYSDGDAYVYKAQRGAWRKYAPIGAKIFTTMRLYFNDEKNSSEE